VQQAKKDLAIASQVCTERFDILIDSKQHRLRFADAPPAGGWPSVDEA
jgi:hypothetical protein